MSIRAIAFATVAAAAFALPARAEGPIGLKVLYAGNPGSDREAQFVGLLKAHFRDVATADYRAFAEKTAEGHDVVILDWTSIYPRDKDGKLTEGGLNEPKIPRVSRRYARPTILIGGPGQSVVRPLGLKINWLCLCLDDAAHGLALDHEVFHEPLAVNPTIVDVPTPEQYLMLASGQPIGKTIKVWKTQTRKFPDLDPGLVSDGDGFEDSPDAEIISAGLSAKGPNSVALGRQGNFFLWGFSASPADLTPEARRCFVNAVCYIRKFEGQAPIVRKVGQQSITREWILMLAHAARAAFDDDAFKTMMPEAIRNNPKAYEQERDQSRYTTRVSFPDAVGKRLEANPGAALAWVEANIEWLYPGLNPEKSEIQIGIDEDVKSLGQSNRKVELLDACVAMLERGDRPEVALRLLRRYTAEGFDSAKGWRAWLDAHRARLFVTESGGCKFLAAPSTLAPPVRPARMPLSAAPVPPEPVAVEAECSPARVRAGEPLTLIVRVRIGPRWHIAARGSKGPEVAASLELKLPDGLEAAGDWSDPAPLPAVGGSLSYAGTVEFRRALRVKAGAHAGPVAATCTLGYQACDPFSCRPPAETTVEARAEVVARR